MMTEPGRAERSVLIERRTASMVKLLLAIAVVQGIIAVMLGAIVWLEYALH